MTLASKIAIAAAVPLLLAGCGTTNRGLESVHQPVVDRTDIAFDVALGDRGLSAGEAQRLDGWLRQDSRTWQPKYPIRKDNGQPAGPPRLP